MQLSPYQNAAKLASLNYKHSISVRNEDKTTTRMLITIFNVQLVSLNNLAHHGNAVHKNKSCASHQGSTRWCGAVENPTTDVTELHDKILLLGGLYVSVIAEGNGTL